MSIQESRDLQREIVEPKKGAQTKNSIIEAALAIASKSGLEGLTIGNIAEAVKMSKSGVFAHFGSREELQQREGLHLHTLLHHRR